MVHVHATVFFFKIHSACHNIANGIKPGNNSKKTDKHDKRTNSYSIIHAS